MEFVITIIANPQKQSLSQAFVHDMAAGLAAQGILVVRTDWLAEGIACDLFTASDDVRRVNALVRGGLNDLPYDVVVQPVAGRRRKLLVADMDSTMITVECIDELADFVGKKREVAAITDRAMNGELDFEAALTARVALLRGLPESVLQQCYDERVKLMPGAKELLASMHAAGAYAVLVSGGFSFFTSRVRAALGFDEDHSNRLGIENGKLTGRVIPPILGRDAKLQALKNACTKQAISSAEVLAVGDGANDVPMLLEAGLGVAYHAKPTVQAQARARLNHCDLTALLFAQGIRPG